VRTEDFGRCDCENENTGLGANELLEYLVHSIA